MSYASRGSGGGGGFGNFPYRSAHQQNNDGNNSNNNRRRAQKKRHEKRRERGGALICRASLKIPIGRRGSIIGRKGQTIKRLTETTRTVINVPGMRNTNPEARVQILGSCVTYVLHACWEISHIVLPLSLSLPRNESDGNSVTQNVTEGEEQNEDEEEHIIYELTIQGVDGILKGKMMMRGTSKNTNDDDNNLSNMAFMVGERKGKHESSRSSVSSGDTTDDDADDDDDNGMSAYCISTQKSLSKDTISIWVDNERFVDSNITATVETIYLSGWTATGATETTTDNNLRHNVDEENEVQDGGDGDDDEHKKEDNDDDENASMLIFIYGTMRERPLHLYSVLSKKVFEYS